MFRNTEMYLIQMVILEPKSKKIEAKSEVHTVDLVECMVTLSAELIQKDIDMIDNIDQERLWEDII